MLVAGCAGRECQALDQWLLFIGSPDQGRPFDMLLCSLQADSMCDAYMVMAMENRVAHPQTRDNARNRSAGAQHAHSRGV